MRLSSLTPTQLSGAQIALAVVLAVIGIFLLLPRPRGRFVPGGIAALIAAIAAFGVWLYSTFGKPMPDEIGSVLFCLFSAGTLGFGIVLVVQRNPARGAIAFAFVILSTCGLFLLLAAPFLMAATIIIYAGAIIVTFLFVLMLSQVQGPSDENDRSREPLFGGLAGFAFTGLVLFTVYLSSIGNNPAEAATAKDDPPTKRQLLPAPCVTGEERTRLLAAADELAASADELNALIGRLNQMNDQHARLPVEDQARRNAIRESQDAMLEAWRTGYTTVAGKLKPLCSAIRLRLTIAREGKNVDFRNDQQAKAVRDRGSEIYYQVDAIRSLVEGDFINSRHILTTRVDEVKRLREEVLLLAGAGELPARNVANIGYLLYSEHLLAVELAGTLLLVATLGAIAIAQRRGAVQ